MYCRSYYLLSKDIADMMSRQPYNVYTTRVLRKILTHKVTKHVLELYTEKSIGMQDTKEKNMRLDLMLIFLQNCYGGCHSLDI
jgi:hypothetical protein